MQSTSQRSWAANGHGLQTGDAGRDPSGKQLIEGNGEEHDVSVGDAEDEPRGDRLVEGVTSDCRGVDNGDVSDGPGPDQLVDERGGTNGDPEDVPTADRLMTTGAS